MAEVGPERSPVVRDLPLPSWGESDERVNNRTHAGEQSQGRHMLAELIGVALLPFALYPRRYDDEGPPEESAAQARYKGRRNVLHAASVRDSDDVAGFRHDVAQAWCLAGG